MKPVQIHLWAAAFQRYVETKYLYVYYERNGPVYLLLYVDDVLNIAKNLSSVEMVEQMLQKEFSMPDLGGTRVFLGLQIDRNRKKGTTKLSQPSYINAVLKRLGMEGCNPSRTPMQINLQFKKSQEV